MNPIELREALRERVMEADQKDIWEGARYIASRYGQLQLCGDDPRIEVCILEIEMPGPHTIFIQSESKSSWEYSPTASWWLQIAISHIIVFEAQGIKDAGSPYSKILPTEQVIRRELQTINISSYIPGAWEEWLDGSVIEKALEEMRRREEEAAERERREQEQKVQRREEQRPLTHAERGLAARFGIALDEKQPADDGLARDVHPWVRTI